MSYRLGWICASLLLIFTAPLLAQAGSRQGSRVSIKHKSFELNPDSDVPVRTELLPPKYDLNGKPQKYTPEELKTLKGSDPKLPGYASDFGHLKEGQLVKVFLTSKKENAKPAGKDTTVDTPSAKDGTVTKPDKKTDTPTYELTGILTHVKSTSKSKKLTLRVDYAALHRRYQGTGSHKEVITDKITSILILSKDQNVSPK